MGKSMRKVDVSIIIVSFNTRDLLRACLESLPSGEIIVVENGSTDGSVEMVKKEFPLVMLIANKENRGFAAANNIGFKKAHGRYLLMLNSDTEVPQGAIEEVTRFMDEHPDVGVVGAKLMLPNGRMDPACHRGFPTPWAALTYFSGLEKIHSPLLSGYHQLYKNLHEPHEIDSPSGAFYFVRREVYETAGGF